MARYDTYDEDDSRLPEGMTRVGYDADTGRYTFQDAAGTFWEGPPGARFGRLERADDRGRQDPSPRDPLLEHVEAHRQLRASNARAWHYVAPFFLILAVFLLMLVRFLNSSTRPAHDPAVACGQDAYPYTIAAGDTCWSIAEDHALSDWHVLVIANPGLDCEGLRVGGVVCVPDPDE